MIPSTAQKAYSSILHSVLSANSLNRWVACGVFGLSLVQSFDGLSATPLAPTPSAAAKQERVQAGADCVLFYTSLTVDEQTAWKNLGYKLQARPNLQSFSPASIANLLGENRYALVRFENRVEMWFGTGPAIHVENWKPLSIKAPGRGEIPGPIYSCAALTRQKLFFRETRLALTQAYALSGQEFKAAKTAARPSSAAADDLKTIAGLSYGETMLALERNYFVHQGTYKWDVETVRTRYRQLLAKAKSIAADKDKDFFETWTQLRNVIYPSFANEPGKVTYCDEMTSMTEALGANCTNCVGETFLLYAIYKDAGFNPPLGWQIGVQSFRGHIRLIVYNAKTQRIHDLATGASANFKSIVYGPEVLLLALLRGHSALKYENELNWIASQTPQRIFQSCFRPAGVGRAENSPSNLMNLYACEKYQTGNDPNPHRASNVGKAQDPHEENDSDQPGASQEQIRKGKSESGETGPGINGSSNKSMSLWDKIKSSGSILGSGFSLLKNYLTTEDDQPSWFRRLDSEEFRSHERSSIKFHLSKIAENLNPEEKKALLESLEMVTPSEDLINRFSLGRQLSVLGYAQFRDLPEYKFDTNDGEKAPVWDSLVLPLFMRSAELQKSLKVPLTNTSRGLCDRVADSTVCKIEVGECQIYRGLCVTINDSTLLTTLQPLGSAERYAYLLRLLSKHYQAQIAKINPVVAAQDPENFMRRLGEFTATTNDEDIYSDLTALDRHIRLHRPLNSQGQVIGSQSPDSLYVASIKSFGNEPLKTLHRHLERLAEVFRGEVIGILRALDKADPNTFGSIKRHLGYAPQYLEAWSPIINLDPALNQKYSSSPTPDINALVPTLLEKTLRDLRFFYTVEPEESERIPGRPYDPWKIEDPRVQDLVATALRSNLPRLNLPDVGVNVRCQPGDHGYKNAGLFDVDCIEASNVRPGDRNQNLNSKQQGQVKTERPGNALKNKVGFDDRNVPQGLRADTTGTEAEGREAYAPDLNPAQLRIRPNYQATSVSNADTLVLQTPLDPRQEVHLKPSTWDFLQPERSLGEISEVDQVLLHHAFRKKLDTVFRFVRFINWTAIDAPRYDSYRFDGTTEQTLQQAVEALKDVSWTQTKALLPFLKVAEEEIRQPKMGYVVLTSHKVAISEAEVLDAMTMNTDQLERLGTDTREIPASRPGHLLPLIYNADDGKSYLTVTERLEITTQKSTSDEGATALQKHVNNTANLDDDPLWHPKRAQNANPDKPVPAQLPAYPHFLDRPMSNRALDENRLSLRRRIAQSHLLILNNGTAFRIDPRTGEYVLAFGLDGTFVGVGAFEGVIDLDFFKRMPPEAFYPGSQKP